MSRSLEQQRQLRVRVSDFTACLNSPLFFLRKQFIMRVDS